MSEEENSALFPAIMCIVHLITILLLFAHQNVSLAGPKSTRYRTNSCSGSHTIFDSQPLFLVRCEPPSERLMPNIQMFWTCRTEHNNHKNIIPWRRWRHDYTLLILFCSVVFYFVHMHTRYAYTKCVKAASVSVMCYGQGKHWKQAFEQAKVIRLWYIASTVHYFYRLIRFSIAHWTMDTRHIHKIVVALAAADRICSATAL